MIEEIPEHEIVSRLQLLQGEMELSLKKVKLLSKQFSELLNMEVSEKSLTDYSNHHEYLTLLKQAQTKINLRGLEDFLYGFKKIFSNFKNPTIMVGLILLTGLTANAQDEDLNDVRRVHPHQVDQFAKAKVLKSLYGACDGCADCVKETLDEYHTLLSSLKN